MKIQEQMWPMPELLPKKVEEKKKRKKQPKEVSRLQFMDYQFPLLPYCSIKRGPSTNFNESFHFSNANTGSQLNFFWNFTNTITVSWTNYEAVSDPWEQSKNIISESKLLNQQIITELCDRYLRELVIP